MSDDSFIERLKRQALYNTRRWRLLRASHMLREPLCVMCRAQGYRVLATVADHIKPHRGDAALFYDAENLQSLCKLHHDAAKKAEENRGVMIGSGIDGTPLDPGHHWNKREGGQNLWRRLLDIVREPSFSITLCFDWTL